MSLGQKEKKNIKKLASKVSNKVEKVGEKARKSLSTQHRYLFFFKDFTLLFTLFRNKRFMLDEMT